MRMRLARTAASTRFPAWLRRMLETWTLAVFTLMPRRIAIRPFDSPATATGGFRTSRDVELRKAVLLARGCGRERPVNANAGRLQQAFCVCLQVDGAQFIADGKGRFEVPGRTFTRLPAVRRRRRHEQRERGPVAAVGFVVWSTANRATVWRVAPSGRARRRLPRGGRARRGLGR